MPINTSYKGEFLRHIVDQSDSKVLVVEGAWLSRVLFILDQLPKLTAIVVRGEVPAEGEGDAGAAAGAVAARNAITADGRNVPLLTWDEFFAAPEDPVEADVLPEDALSIIYTSGTTGLSKGALGSHKFWVVCAEKMLDYRDGGKDDVFYTFLPLYHFNAQVLTLLTALVAEASMVLSDKFSASGFWDDIRKYGATQFNYLGRSSPSWRSSRPGPTTRTTRPGSRWAPAARRTSCARSRSASASCASRASACPRSASLSTCARPTGARAPAASRWTSTTSAWSTTTTSRCRWASRARSCSVPASRTP